MFDRKRVRSFWIVISRWRWHYFQNSTIEHIGFKKNLPVAKLELVDCCGHLSYGEEKGGTFLCTRFIDNIKIYPHQSITYVVMFDSDLTVQLSGKLFKTHYSKFSGMRWVEDTVSLFFNDFSKISFVNQIITACKSIYNLLGSGIYHQLHSIFKS